MNEYMYYNLAQVDKHGKRAKQSLSNQLLINKLTQKYILKKKIKKSIKS